MNSKFFSDEIIIDMQYQFILDILMSLLNYIKDVTWQSATKVTAVFAVNVLRQMPYKRITSKESLPMREISRSAIMSHIAYKDPQVLHNAGEPSIEDADPCLARGLNALQSLCGSESVNDYEIVFFDGRPIEGTQAYFWRPLKGQKHAFVVFRGTDELKDAFDDIDIRRTQLGDDKNRAKVHLGFYKQYQVVREALMTVLETHAGDYEEVYVMGHSLGGALATLAAPDIASLMPDKKVHCHTFGSPRVGDDAFVEYFDKRVASCWRVFNQEDPVRLVPISHRFKHVHGGLCITDNLAVLSETDDLPWYLRPVFGFMMLDFKGLIKDHDCGLYVDRCLTFVKDEKHKGKVAE